jgi:hypothetical protein
VTRDDGHQWAGRSAFVVASGLAIGWAGALLIVAFKGGPISHDSANVLATLGGAMAGAVATYLGSTFGALGAPNDGPGRPVARDDAPADS